MVATGAWVNWTGEALAQGLVSGDEQAVQALLDAYWERGYRVALGLTGDPAKAEDAVQEAVLTALRAADGFDIERGSFQAWFFGIVHHRARDQRRASARRKRYEEAAAVRRRERLDEASDHEETAIVLGELAELEPKLRAAVTLRYVEGLSYREIGEALGWPEGTATSRVQRGLKRLRGRLRQLETAAPSLLSSAAIKRLLRGPLGEAPAAPTPQDLLGPEPAGAPPVAAVGASKLGLGLGLLALALVVALLAALVAGEGTPPAPDQARASDPVGAAATPNAATRDPAAAILGDADPAPGPSTSPRRPDGTESTDGDATGAATPAAGPAHTGARASAVLVGRVQPAPLDGAWIAVVDRDYGPGTGFQVSPDDEAHGLGRLFGGWGHANPDHHSDALPETYQALQLGTCYALDPDGSFRIPLPEDRGQLLLAAGARGFANQTAIVAFDAQGAEPVTLTLEDWIGVAEQELILVDAQGTPLEVDSAFLVARSEGLDAIPGRPHARERVTCAAGRVRLDLAPGRTFLRVSTGRLSSPSVRLELRAGPNPPRTLRLVEPQQGALRVTVVDAGGQPVAGAHVSTNGATPELRMRPLHQLANPSFMQHVTDAEGQVTVSDLRLGAYVVLARAGAWGGRSETISLAPPGGERELTVVLDEPITTGHLRLRLLDPEGRPLREDDRVTELQSTLELDGVQCAELPQEDGSLLLVDVAEGDYALTAFARVWLRGAGDTELSTPEPLTVTVRRGETTEVEVSLAEHVRPPERHLATVILDTGLELEQSQLACSPTADGQGVQEASGPGSEYLLHGATLDAQVQVVAWSEHHWPVAARIPTDGGDHTVRLDDSLTWVFEVVDESGQPLPGAELNVRDLPWDTNYSAVVYEVDDTGTARLRGVPQALYVDHDECRGVRWSPPDDGQAPAEPIRVVLHREQTNTAEAAVVRGVVLDPDGWPAPGVRVNVVSETGEVERAQTDPDGSFELPNCPSGRLTVLCFRGDLGVSALTDLEVAPGEVLEGVELAYGPSVEVVGRVHGQARRAQRIRIQPVDPRLAEILRGEIKFRTGGSAELILGPWPPGRWRFQLADGEGRPLGAWQELELRAGEPAPELDFEVR